MKEKSSTSPQSKQRNKAHQSGTEAYHFPVVVIGASAGGFEAIEILLSHIPHPSGMAFVIVQHMDPTHQAIMAELLQRHTPMQVLEVADGLQLKQDHVYVIPPGMDMSLLHGKLYLFEMTQPRGQQRPIDFFFRSVAYDMKELAIGVILSGMGSDGTFGVRDIKGEGGLVLVQDPLSAKFDGMPRSAIDAGLADIVAPAEELYSRIRTYLKQIPLIAGQRSDHDGEKLSSLEKAVILLRTHTGHDFSQYKKNTIYRRIERRMGIHQINTMTEYIGFMKENSQESDLLFKELLIGVTSFFRDPSAWEVLKERVLSSYVALKESGGVLRAWVAGCSTGEEAYSLAVVLKEAFDSSLTKAKNPKIQIFASDLDKDAIEKARTGVYPTNIEAEVSPERLRRFFEKDETGYRVSREIRELIVFAQHDVIMDPPFTKLDILICRNLMIYMESDLQKKLLQLFHYSLRPGGTLFLGTAETAESCSHLFEPLNNKYRIFRQAHSALRSDSLTFPAAFSSALQQNNEYPESAMASPPIATGLQAATDHLLLQQFSPPAVLTNQKGDIIYINGRTGKFLEPPSGQTNWNIFAMAREGLDYELHILFRNAVRKPTPCIKKHVMIGKGADSVAVDVWVEQLKAPLSLANLILTVFDNAEYGVTPKSVKKAPVSATGVHGCSALEHELKEAHDVILAIREEMQSSQEELKSANEEMQSANEELQSTNEELTTSKEEMQSLNEELHTVNQELQTMVTDLSRTNNDMKNLLNSTDIATLFLDDSLNIRRFTTRTATIIKLIPGDIGRPITDLVTDLNYPDLAEDSRTVLQSLSFREKSVSTADGRWFRVKIMPYRTLENRIDGLVITFTDTTASQQFEKSLAERNALLQFLMESVSGGIIVQNEEGMITYANSYAERVFGVSLPEMQGRLLEELPWKTVRKSGAVVTPEEHPSQIARGTGKQTDAIVIGITPHRDLACRWISLHAAPRLIRETPPAYDVVSFFSEIQ